MNHLRRPDRDWFLVGSTFVTTAVTHISGQLLINFLFLEPPPRHVREHRLPSLPQVPQWTGGTLFEFLKFFECRFNKIKPATGEAAVLAWEWLVDTTQVTVDIPPQPRWGWRFYEPEALCVAIDMMLAQLEDRSEASVSEARRWLQHIAIVADLGLELLLRDDEEGF